MPTLSLLELDQLAREGGVKLEMTGGIPTWEAFPSSRHQEVIDDIRATIGPATSSSDDCSCRHLSDVTIRFKDDSVKRPDIAIFCTKPPRQDEALTQIPEAVVEIISPGYEYKDIVLNPTFYLGQGVLDVVIVDPRSGAVTHYRPTGKSEHVAPVTLNFQCGCRCTIPDLG